MGVHTSVRAHEMVAGPIGFARTPELVTVYMLHRKQTSLVLQSSATGRENELKVGFYTDQSSKGSSSSFQGLLGLLPRIPWVNRYPQTFGYRMSCPTAARGSHQSSRHFNMPAYRQESGFRSFVSNTFGFRGRRVSPCLP